MEIYSEDFFHELRKMLLEKYSGNTKECNERLIALDEVFKAYWDAN